MNSIHAWGNSIYDSNRVKYFLSKSMDTEYWKWAASKNHNMWKFSGKKFLFLYLIAAKIRMWISSHPHLLSTIYGILMNSICTWMCKKGCKAANWEKKKPGHNWTPDICPWCRQGKCWGCKKSCVIRKIKFSINLRS